MKSYVSRNLLCADQGNGVTYTFENTYTFTMTLNLFVHLIKEVKTVIYSVRIPDVKKKKGSRKMVTIIPKNNRVKRMKRRMTRRNKMWKH